ncbi:MAG: Ig-like domain-containing protein [bacterium]
MSAKKPLLLALTLFILLLSAAAPALWAATTLQSITPLAHSGGKFYSVKVVDIGGTKYFLAGNESGLQIYSQDGPPILTSEYPSSTASYTGGASGLEITNFKTAVDGITIGTTEYAFYADGVNLYVINVDTVGTPTLASSYGVANVRAVTVAATGSTSKYYAYALAYRPQVNIEDGEPLPPNTLLYIFDVTTPTSISLAATLELDTDSETPNNTGACDLVYVADIDNDSTADYDGDGEDYDPYLFIADGVEGLKAVDLTGLELETASYPTTNDIYQTDTSGTATGLDVVRFGSTLYAFVADGPQGLKIFDVTNPTSMPTDDSARTGAVTAFTYATGYSGYAYDVKLFGTTAFIANGQNGVQVVDVSDPANPVDLTLSDAGSYIDSTGSYNRLKGTAFDLDFVVDTDTLYTVVAWGEAGLVRATINIDNIVNQNVTTAIADYVIDDDIIYVRTTNGKLASYNIDATLSAKTALTAAILDTGGAANMICVGDYLFAIDSSADDAAPNDDIIAMIQKSDLSKVDVTNSVAGVISKLYYDSADEEAIYFLEGTNNKLGKVVVDTVTPAFGAETLSPASYATTDLVVAGNYVYGVKQGAATTLLQVAKADITAAPTDLVVLGADIVKLATDGTYVYCLTADGKLNRVDSSGNATTSAIAFTAGSTQLFIQDGYAYGIDTLKLARISTSFASGDDSTVSTVTIDAASLITGDGVDIYINDAGKITKVAMDRLGDTDWDGFSSGTLVEAAEEIIVVDGYVYGVDNGVTTTIQQVGFKATEANNTIALNEAAAGGGKDNFGGYAKDIALYTDGASGSNDYVYVADGSKGIRRYTVTDPTLHTAWDPVILTDVDKDGTGGGFTANGDVSDEWDIYDARGVDFAYITDFAHSVILVADGTKGVKLVNSGATALLPGDSAVSNKTGYIVQHDATAADSLTGNNETTDGAAAEDIKYFKVGSTHYAAVANGSAGLVILSFNATTGVVTVVARVSLPTGGYAYGVDVDTANNLVYVAAGTIGVVIVELDPDEDDSFTDAALLDGGTYTYSSVYYGSNHEAYSITLDDPTDPEYAFVAYGTRGVIVLDISDPSAPVKKAIYPSTGQVDGKACDIAYADSTLYVAMSYGAVLSLDVADTSHLDLRDSMNTFGEARGIAFGNVDGGSLKKKNHLFIANGPGGMLSALVKYQMQINTVVTNVQTQEGGDTVKLIGSGFFDDAATIKVTVNGDDVGTVTIADAFELTFTAPSQDAGTYDIRVYDNDSELEEDTASSSITYAPEGSAILGLFADTTTQGGITSPGGNVTLDLVLHNNGAGNLISAKALIKYDKNKFQVLNSGGMANVVGQIDPNTAFTLNTSLTDLTATTSIIDLNPNDDYLSLMISIYGTEPFSTSPDDKITLGTVSFTVPTDVAGDQLLTLDNTTGQEVSIPHGDVVPATGSVTMVYVKQAAKLTCDYTSETLAAGGTEAFGVGPFAVTVSEILDPDEMVENAEITFSVSSDALIDADGVTSVYRVNTGTLKTGSSVTTSPITVKTTSAGAVSVGLNIGTKAGTYTMTISGVSSDGAPLTGSPITKTFTISAETDPGDDNDSISLAANTQTPAPGDTVTITATAYDRYGNAMEDELVTLSTDKGSLSVTSGETDSNGQITTNLKLLNSIATHTVTASYDSAATSTTLEVTPIGPDVNADGSFTIADIQTAINYHLNWTDLSSATKPSGKSYVPGDTNHNDRFDLNEVVAIINLAMELGMEVE